jgi:hypothetical protein
MKRAYYSSTIYDFCKQAPDQVLGEIARKHSFDLTAFQRDAWIEQTALLRDILLDHNGKIYFEFSIPRMGRRIDAVVIIGPAVFVIEFKVGASAYEAADIDQVMDYALDLRNFHEGSHHVILVQPTPTIIEATLALYNGHSVSEISRSDANAVNLSETSNSVAEIIARSKDKSEKSIIFVTGVPGSGKTLVGLNVATTHIDTKDELYSVFLSGNGPLVKVLQEALARDKVAQGVASGVKIRKGDALSEVKAFIQNVHHFRDDGLVNLSKPPIEHVALFDEAQRAWTKDQTIKFMREKKNQHDFSQSEPEFLISCMDRHSDWATVVCLVGGGQEINTGEAGIGAWFEAIEYSFPHWKIYLSDRLNDSEYGSGRIVNQARENARVTFLSDLHLRTSVRSFRSEKVSLFVKQLLDLENAAARESLLSIHDKYPIVLTRNLKEAKDWVRTQARGSERYGMVVSSQAVRLKPYAIDVRVKTNPVHWFLNGKDDVRSSYYLEDVATEFDVQGLELDWVCMAWDADFRYSNDNWGNWSFRGSRWQRISKPERQMYQKNAYRVLLTRARQGMVLFVPEGDDSDPTRPSEYYDATYNYLSSMGMRIL